MKRVTRVNPGFVLISASAIALVLVACVKEGDDAPPLPGALGPTAMVTAGAAGAAGAGMSGASGSGGGGGQGGSGGNAGGQGGSAGSGTTPDAGTDAGDAG